MCPGYWAEHSLAGDKTAFVFSKLQDGETFTVSVEYCVTPGKAAREVG